LKYRLVALDVDGTLIDSRHRITERTVKAIKSAASKGIIFIISTGRPIQSAIPMMEELGLDVPFITYNGAMVVMGKSGDILYEVCIEPGHAGEIYRLGEEYGTTIIVWSKNRLYVNRMDERAYFYGKQARTMPELLADPERIFRQGVIKILWYDEIESINRYVEEMKFKLKGDVNYHTSKPFYLEFVNNSVSKALALQKISEYYGIKRNEIIAIGDGYNDLSMIEYAGLGVAMANSEQEIKGRADYITLSNDEDGVAEVIEKFLLR
jgi:Cof subfamily protein (haloacid dehalogenase superfamily)